jgi:hypothetical protein
MSEAELQRLAKHIVLIKLSNVVGKRRRQSTRRSFQQSRIFKEK